MARSFRLYVPGIERYPDLEKRFNAEMTRLGAECSTCKSRPVLKKYQALVAQREKRQRR